MITKEMVEQLRTQRPAPNARLEYTPDHPFYVRIVTCTHAEHNRKILQGDRTLALAGQKILDDFRQEKAHGFAKGHFNHHSQELKP